MDNNDVVCFCNFVTAGAIRKAIDTQDLKSVGDVMGATYAASLCGSCLDRVIAVTNEHLARD